MQGYSNAMPQPTNQEQAPPALNPDVCRRARQARDPRFDGEFFLAVRTTGIYCRPICPARSPAEKNVHYFRHATQAAQAGYRPCLRCRPESAPHSPAWRGSATTVERALQLIEAGALNEGSMDELSARLGVGERYLRKLFQREVGASPLAVAQNQRLLFAKKLLAETNLSITDAAYAAGFGSIRRFNSAVSEAFDCAPGSLRKKKLATNDNSVITLQLHYRPPYDWDGVLALFERHAIEGVEHVDAAGYQRNIRIDGAMAHFRIEQLPRRNALSLALQLPDQRALMPVVANIRRMFDLDANPDVIASALNQDPKLAQLLQRFPGIRSPIHWSPFESAIRAVVGQQVSVAAARNVVSKLVAACDQNPRRCFPSAASIGALDDHVFAMPTRRRDTLRALCANLYDREEQLQLSELAAIKGIGPWTTNLVSMRGFGDPDIFPPGDLGLVNAWCKDSNTTAAGLTSATSQWRPWRSYAANLLWRSLSL